MFICFQNLKKREREDENTLTIKEEYASIIFGVLCRGYSYAIFKREKYKEPIDRVQPSPFPPCDHLACCETQQTELSIFWHQLHFYPAFHIV